MISQPEELLGKAIADPDAFLRALDKADAEASLLSFVRLMWPVLEPGRTFLQGWLLECICEHLEAVTAGQIKKLLINVPPGAMKSLLLNVFWPAWEWGPRNKPEIRYLSTSYSETLTIRDNRKCRTLIDSPLYQSLWGHRFKISTDQNEKRKYENDHMGFKLATSVRGVATGERADRINIDDPHNVKEVESEVLRQEVLHWFTEVMPTRVNDPGKSTTCLIMQRTHYQDVSGLIIEKDLGYEHLIIPMEFESKYRCYTKLPRKDREPERVRRTLDSGDPIPHWVPDDNGVLMTCQDRRTEEGELMWPERFPKEYLEEELKPTLRAIGGSHAEAGQLQQRPSPRSGGMFKRDSFNFVDEMPKGLKWVRGWDLAATKDGRGAYTACVKMAKKDGRVYISDVRRKRGSPNEVREMIFECAESDGKSTIQDIPQDPGQAGKSQKSELAAMLLGYDVKFSAETGSKEDRARGLAACLEAGNLYLLRAPWNDLFIAECSFFPAGFKDQVDAATRAFARLIQKKKKKVGAGPKAIYG